MKVHLGSHEEYTLRDPKLCTVFKEAQPFLQQSDDVGWTRAFPSPSWCCWSPESQFAAWKMRTKVPVYTVGELGTSLRTEPITPAS